MNTTVDLQTAAAILSQSSRTVASCGALERGKRDPNRKMPISRLPVHPTLNPGDCQRQSPGFVAHPSTSRRQGTWNYVEMGVYDE